MNIALLADDGDLAVEGLAAVMIDSVEGGASVGFLWTASRLALEGPALGLGSLPDRAGFSRHRHGLARGWRRTRPRPGPGRLRWAGRWDCRRRRGGAGGSVGKDRKLGHYAAPRWHLTGEERAEVLVDGDQPSSI